MTAIVPEQRSARIARNIAWRTTFIRECGGRCHYCNRRGDSVEIGPDGRPWHIDHKDPIAKGGIDEEANLVLACKRCNLNKGTKPYRVFKTYARMNYWINSGDGVEGFDLQALLDLCESIKPTEYYGHNPRFIADGRQIKVDNGDGDLDVVYTIRPGKSIWRQERNANMAVRAVVQFLEAADQLLPLVIAELRLLRAEVADRSAPSYADAS